MNNNLNDSELEKIMKIKKSYTYQFCGMLSIFTLTTTLIYTRDFFNILPKEYYGHLFSNPGTFIALYFFLKYLSNMSFEIESIINPQDNDVIDTVNKTENINQKTNDDTSNKDANKK